jgi:hypothetical protein
MQVTEWKKAMTAGASGVFGPGRAKARAFGWKVHI